MATSAEKQAGKGTKQQEKEVIWLQYLKQLAVLSGIFQHREATKEATIREYMTKYRNGEELPALTAARVNDGLYLIDGFHRYEALKRLYETERPREIEVVVIPCKDEKEARWIGAQGNMRHGLQLTRKDRRNVFRVYVEAGKHREEESRGRRHKWRKYKSWRQIAKDLGINHRTAHEWMKKDFKNIWEEMIGEEGHDMSEVDTMGKQRGPMSMTEAAIDSVDKAYQAAQGIEKEAERLEVIRHVQALAKRLMQEHLGRVPHGEEQGVFGEPESDF